MKIISVDIGHNTVKISEIISHFKQWDFVSFYEEKIDIETNNFSEHLKISLKIIKMMWEKYKISGDKVVATIPTELIVSHILEIPLTNTKKIKNAIVPEIEEIVPFDLEQMIFEYQIASKFENKSIVISNLLKRDVYEQIIDAWSEIDVPLHILTTEYSAYSAIFRLNPENLSGNYLLVDIGHKQTVSALFNNGVLASTRSLLFGGDNINKEIIKAYDCDQQQAEIAKIENPGLIVSEERNNEEQQKFHRIIEEAIKPLLIQINQTLLGVQATKRIRINKIYLTGGTSGLKNLCEYVESRLRIPTQILQVDPYIQNFQVPNLIEKQRFWVKSVGMALALVKKESGPFINFKKYKIIPGQLYQNISSLITNNATIGLGKTLTFFGVILCIHLVGGVILNKIYETRAANRTKDAISKTFPDISKTFQKKLIESSQKLEDYLDENLNDQRIKLSLMAEKNWLMIDFLNNFNGSFISQKTKVNKISISKTQRVVTIEGLIEPDASEILKTNLSKINNLESPRFEYNSDSKNFVFNAIVK